MNERDAYRGMKRFRHSSLELDRLLGEVDRGHSSGDLSAMVERIRGASSQRPSESTETAHIETLVRESQSVRRELRGSRIRNRPGLRTSRLIRVTAIAMGLALLMAQFAVASGLHVPGLSQASEWAGNTLGIGDDTPEPDQLPPAASDQARRVLAAINANQDLVKSGELSGCEFGALVTAASENTAPDFSDCPGRRGGEGIEDDEIPSPDQLPSSASDGARRVLTAIQDNLPLLGTGELSGCEFGALVTAASQNTAPDFSDCPARSGAAGNRQSSAGQATAEQQSTAGKAKGAEQSSAGQATAEGQSSAGKAKAETQSSAGKAKAEEQSSAGKAKAEGQAPPGGD